MRSWIRYWIAIPIACAIKNRLSLYEVYSQAWELNNIHFQRVNLQNSNPLLPGLLIDFPDILYILELFFQ